MKFKVTYTETSVREIDIEASSPEEAGEIVQSGNFDCSNSCETYSELARVDSVEEIS